MIAEGGQQMGLTKMDGEKLRQMLTARDEAHLTEPQRAARANLAVAAQRLAADVLRYCPPTLRRALALRDLQRCLWEAQEAAAPVPGASALDEPL
jgi:hypothetical protein